MILYRRDGRPVALGAEIARGGEGRILTLEGEPALVAKLYHRPPDDGQVRKLFALVAAHTPKLAENCAWPDDLLRHGDGRVVGLILPRVGQALELHQLTGIRDRRQLAPDIGHGFLIRLALNLAHAVACVHAHGHVIGDINQRLALVNKQGATLRLIDCDSFQISHGGTVFPCDVGVPEFQPPEHQGVASFRALPRRPGADAFGLAVLLFQVLFLGFHPFAGRPLGATPMLTLPQAIAQRRYAHGPGAGGRGVAPPAGSPPVTLMGPEIADLFERAFTATTDLDRPAPASWVAALKAFERAAIPCQTDGAHRHLPSDPCPLCAWQAATGVEAFKPRPPPRFVDPRPLILAWRAWHDAQPTALTLLPQHHEARSLAEAPLPVRSAPQPLWSLFRSRTDQPHHRQLALREALQREIRSLDGGALTQTMAQAERTLAELEARIAHWLPAALREQPDAAAVLARVPLAPGIVMGLGPRRWQTLQAAGIRTAADLPTDAALAINGIGRILARRLLNWRAALLKQAKRVYSPPPPMTPAERAEGTALAQRVRAAEGDARARLATARAEAEACLDRVLRAAEALRDAYGQR